jgi:hypothetical protein
MMELLSLSAGVVLLVLLIAFASKRWVAARDFQETALPAGEADAEACPEVFVSRVFSRGDWEFVHSLRSEGISKLFDRERKKVALLWVQQTSVMIRKAMREHASAARQSENLQFSTEISILAQFLTLIVVCGILSVAIQTVGPLFLAGLARFAQRLSRRVAKVQESLQSAPLVNTAGRIA